MRLSTASFLRRARRLGFSSVFPRTHPLWSSPPAKHVKIDDEEQQSSDSHILLSKRASSRRMLKMLLLCLLLLLFLVFLTAYIIYKPPRVVIHFLQWKYPDVLFHVPLPSDQKMVALTLDDAPSGETAKILDTLKIYGAKATFFVIGGQVASHPDLLQRIHDEGHEVGNHAWADEPSIKLSISELARQIQQVDGMLPKNPGGSKYFRPGSGFFNKKIVQAAKSQGYRTVLGSIFPHDPQIHSAKINAAHVLSMAKPGGIIIMHDRRSYSSEQVERVLRGLAAKEWKVVSLGELLATGKERREDKGG